MADSASQNSIRRGEHGEKKPGRCRPSKGWKRWIILAGLFLISFLEVGSIRTLSLFLDDLTFHFDSSTTYMGAIYGLVSGMPYFLALLNIPLIRHLSVRQFTMFGGIVSSGGLIAASYSGTTPLITTALIVYGLGYVFIVLPTNSCPADYFPDRFEIATGIFVSGGSVGVMLMPWLFETVINEYGWRGGLLLLAAINTHFILIGSLLKPTKKQLLHQEQKAPESGAVEVSGHTNSSFEQDTRIIDSQGDGSDFGVSGTELQEKQAKIQREEPDVTTDNQANKDILSTIESDVQVALSGDDYSNQIRCCNCISSITNFFKDHPLMIIICIQVYLFALPYGTWLLFTIPNAQAKGLTELRATQLSIAGGIANFLGRFSCGFITSRKLARIEVWYMVANMISATGFFLNYVANTFWFLLILSLLFGYTVGFKAPAQFTLVMNAVGKEYYKTGLGILFVCGGSAFPILGFIAGAIYDATQSYNIAFCVMGGLDICAAVLIITPVVWKRFCRDTIDKSQ